MQKQQYSLESENKLQGWINNFFFISVLNFCKFLMFKGYLSLKSNFKFLIQKYTEELEDIFSQVKQLPFSKQNFNLSNEIIGKSTQQISSEG